MFFELHSAVTIFNWDKKCLEITSGKRKENVLISDNRKMKTKNFLYPVWNTPL